MEEKIISKFKIGDVVQLNSGGEPMTVAQVEGTLNMQTAKFDNWTGELWCTWFLGTELKRVKFHQDALKLAK